MSVAFLSQLEIGVRCKSRNSPSVLPNLGRCQDVSCCTSEEAALTSACKSEKEKKKHDSLIAHQKHVSWVSWTMFANESISSPPPLKIYFVKGSLATVLLQPDDVAGFTGWRAALFFGPEHPTPLKSVDITPQAPWG